MKVVCLPFPTVACLFFCSKLPHVLLLMNGLENLPPTQQLLKFPQQAASSIGSMCLSEENIIALSSNLRICSVAVWNKLQILNSKQIATWALFRVGWFGACWTQNGFDSLSFLGQIIQYFSCKIIKFKVRDRCRGPNVEQQSNSLWTHSLKSCSEMHF